MLGLKLNHVSKRGHWYHCCSYYPHTLSSLPSHCHWPIWKLRHLLSNRFKISFQDLTKRQGMSLVVSVTHVSVICSFWVTPFLTIWYTILYTLTRYLMGSVVTWASWRLKSPATRLWLTHWGRDKMDVISQTTLSNAFSWMTMVEFRLRFHWSLFIRVQLTIIHHWFR